MNMKELTIQPAVPSNSLGLAKLAEKTFMDAFAHMNNEANIERYVAHAFTEHQIRSELLDSAVTFFIAKLKFQWVGYAKLNQSPPPECVKQLPAIELSRLYVMQKYLGSGIGLALLEACTSYAHSKAFKTLWLGSWKENHRGNAFYNRMGFEIVGNKTFLLGSDLQEDYVFARSLK